jgi:SAM-dependent methyltransferase
MTQNKKCPICETLESKLVFDDGRDFFVAEGNSDQFGVWYCKKCEIGFSVPDMTDAELAKYYPDDFEAYVPKKSLIGYLQKIKYRQDLRIIRKALKVNKLGSIALFEIGAGRGEFLNEAKKQGLEVAGIEPGKKGVEFAKDHYNIHLQQGFASDLNFKQKYDVIVMRHVLEHLNSFQECLKEISKNGLKTNGLLFIKVPNIGSWEAKFFRKFCLGFDLPRHRFHFTANGLRDMLKVSAFSECVIYNEIIPNDCVRSLFYYSKHSDSCFRKIVSCILFIPKPLLYVLMMPSLYLLSFLFGAGRIIIVAKKR